MKPPGASVDEISSCVVCFHSLCEFAKSERYWAEFEVTSVPQKGALGILGRVNSSLFLYSA